MEKTKKRIAILGSTGSIGTQALEVIEKHQEYFEVEVLTANNKAALLIEQAKKFQPNAVIIANTAKYAEVKDALDKFPIKVFAGESSIAQIVESSSIDLVLTAMVGYSGLLPTINAIKSGKNIALANKETLVVAGKLIMKLAEEKNTNIYPVDSEHSAIFQCLIGEDLKTIEKIYLTASGGPFRKFSRAELEHVTKNQALQHPNWNMGAKVTIDSASLMNKGLEAIEARWLFDLKPQQIEVIIHPQSIIHSMVQFYDSSIKAQMSLPDMKLPIQYALGFPFRLPSDLKRFNFMNYPQLSFEQPDTEKFPNLLLAFRAMEQCGNSPCVLNAANEVAVDAFLQEKISFNKMPQIIEKTMEKINFIAAPDYEDFVETDKNARAFAKSLL